MLLSFSIEGYLTVFLMGMVKFLFAPLAGITFSLNFYEIGICSGMGVFTTSVILSIFGERLRKWYLFRFPPKKKKKIFSPSKRRMVKIWSTYGLPGIAILTPIFFSPIVGTILAVSLGAKKNNIILAMTLSGFFWGFVFGLIVDYGGAELLKSIMP